jgi:hypothetical protein
VHAPPQITQFEIYYDKLEDDARSDIKTYQTLAGHAQQLRVGERILKQPSGPIGTRHGCMAYHMVLGELMWAAN